MTGESIVGKARIALRVGVVGLVTALAAGVVLARPSRGSGADKDTVALWLFDDPPYLNATLTDAGESHYDLRLDRAGLLAPGRFGGAVGRGAHKSGQAVSFAETPQHFSNDWQGTLESRPATPPAELLKPLQEGDWTWEFQLQLASRPQEEVCVIDAGQQAFYCALAGSDRLLVRSALAGFDLSAPIQGRLAMGAWHHVAFTWSRQQKKLCCFIDGVLAGEPTPIPPAVHVIRNEVGGLVGRIFASSDFTRPTRDEVALSLDCEWGSSRGVDWSERWSGWLIAPITGEVCFRAEASGRLRWRLGETTVIDGWGKDRARTGRLQVVRGDRYVLVLEHSHQGDKARLRLFWSWKDHPEEIIPETAFAYTPRGPASYRFDLALLSDQNGDRPCPAWLDEMRVSRVRRYPASFAPPGSFSRHGRDQPLRAAAPGALPLLFAEGRPKTPAPLGARKHVFIDDALIANRHGVELRQCCARRIERTDFRYGVGDASVLDAGGAIRLYYGGWNDNHRLAISTDGLRFQHPDHQIAQWGGQAGLGGDAIFRLPGQASFFLDGNPEAPAEERFKSIAWIMTRGIYALTSPDGIHWRRNETMLLPFDCGGGVEGFWDDQRGLYVCHIRHEGCYARGLGLQRIAARAESNRFLAPWPFQPDPHPVPRRALTLPALWKELPTPFVPTEGGQVYRTRAIKYPWAPDVYLAFVWRYDVPNDLRPTELAVSRDGANWTFMGLKPAYLPVGVQFDGEHIAKAALPVFGLIRRGDEIWQYAALDTRGHGGPDGYASLQRLTRRLDGFVGLEAGGQGGWAETKPLVFSGRRLELNVAARGQVRVGLLDERGASIPGFAVEDCRPIREDSVRLTVRWKAGEDASPLAGRPVRLRFEMADASLYAFQFVP